MVWRGKNPRSTDFAAFSRFWVDMELSSENPPLAFRLRGVARRAGNGTRPLLEGIDLDVPRGATLEILGPSGAGKSTLLRLLNRMDEAAAGEITVLGKPLAAWPVRELRRRVALVFQESSLLGLNVKENLALPFRLEGELPADFPARISQALERVELEEDLLSRDADGLSVGQKQRVCLARALMTGPEVLLLDEPTSGLDPGTGGRLLSRLVALSGERELTLVIATHRFQEVRSPGSRFALLMEGKIVAEGLTANLHQQSFAPEVEAFLHGSSDAEGASGANGATGAAAKTDAAGESP
jgi:ABC-type methionine transport system ATPase subunit